nr:carboxypeptidase B-like isoform X1 [Crassostrea gigas]
MTGTLLSVLMLLCGYVLADPKRFDGHKVLHILPGSIEHLNNVLELKELLNLNIWRHPRMGNLSMDVHVEPHKLELVLTSLQQIGADVRVWIHDIQQLIDKEQKQTKKKDTGFNYFAYHRFSAIKKYLADVVTAANSMNNVSAQLTTIGYSFEFREIQMIKVSRNDGLSRPAIVIDGGIHAREWISPATVLYFIGQLVSGDEFDYSSKLLDKFDWYFIPLLNPDGYEYSHTTDRLWRKNRVNHGEKCIGVDINRNFGYMWNPVNNRSTNSCSDVYAGPFAFSEEESFALKMFILNNKDNITAYLTYHSYGQMWLYPWGYTSALPTDWQELDSAATVGTEALESLYGTPYLAGPTVQNFYSATGVSEDWAKGVANIKYSYTIELRDTGSFGFLLPQDEIEPNCRESWKALGEFALALAARERYKEIKDI